MADGQMRVPRATTSQVFILLNTHGTVHPDPDATPRTRRTGQPHLQDPYPERVTDPGNHDETRRATADDLDAAVDRTTQHIAATLDGHMTRHGLSTRDVARAAGVSVGTVHAVRTGSTRVETRVLARLEAALGVSLWPVSQPNRD